MPRLRTTLITVVLVIVALVGMASARLYYYAHDPVWRLVQHAFRQTYTTPASYLQTVERRFGPRSEREVYRIWQEGRTRRVVQTEPENRRGLTLVVKAPASWTYAPGMPVILKSFAPRLLPFEHEGVRRLTHGPPRAAVENTVVLAGTPARVIALGSRGGVRLRLWVHERSGFILRQERYNRRGELLDVTTNTQVTHNLPEIRRALATPRPPLRVTSDRSQWIGEFVVKDLGKRSQAGFAVPAQLPPGFHLETGDVFSLNKTEVVALRFARRRQVISLFQHPGTSDPDLGPNRPPAGRRGGILVHKRVIDGRTLVLIGPLSDKDAGRVFGSLKWHEVAPAKGGKQPGPGERGPRQQ